MESNRPKMGRPRKDKPTVLKSIRLSPEMWRLRDKLAKALKKPKQKIIEDALVDMAQKHNVPLD